jgi:hypothetical protein
MKVAQAKVAMVCMKPYMAPVLSSSWARGSVTPCAAKAPTATATKPPTAPSVIQLRRFQNPMPPMFMA